MAANVISMAANSSLMAAGEINRQQWRWRNEKHQRLS
jgi:hypothetical protein